jgi:hypothetical protein
VIGKGTTATIILRNSWGGIKSFENRCLVIRRVYLAYESKDSKWEVMTADGALHFVSQNNLKPIAHAKY